MAMPRKEVDFNKIYKSNKCGDFIILRETEPIRYGSTTCRMVVIKFLYSNMEYTVRLNEALSGSVKDMYYPTVCGVGYLGPIEKGEVPKVIYDMWYHMLERCYLKTSAAYRTYGALGVTVCERWKCLYNFYNDLPRVMGYQDLINNPDVMYSLDKDILQQGIPDNCKVYSISTCVIIKQEDNSRTCAISKHSKGCSSEYYGLYKTNYGTFQCTITINNIKYFLGTYKNEIAAANVYNYVISRIIPGAALNKVPMMSIGEALSYYSGKKPIEVPPQMTASDKFIFSNAGNCSSKYIGVGVRKDSGSYYAVFQGNMIKYNLGIFDSEIAAANAYNYKYAICNPNSPLPNQVKYMTIGEVMKHKRYIRGKEPVEMCCIVDKKKKGESSEKKA